MKAVQITGYGGNEVVKVALDVPEPSISDEQVLVEVKAASINPADWKLRAGLMTGMKPLNFPVTLGGDFAGVVTEVGGAVEDFKVGDDVYGQAIVLGGGSGAWAETVAAKAGNVAIKPKRVDFIRAAALPLVGVSAVQAIEEQIKLQPGQKILIHGGAGGIGHVAIQVAKALGGWVATTVKGGDRELVQRLSADEVIDYTRERFEEKLKDLDAVFDTVGGEVTERSVRVLREGGVLVSMVGEPNQEATSKQGVTGVGQFTRVTTEGLIRLKELVDGGQIKVHVDKTFQLNEVRAALEYQETVHSRGKVVLVIKLS